MILFINPPSRAGIYQGLGDSLAAIEPPIWCRLLASYCEKRGIETDILDLNAIESSDIGPFRLIVMKFTILYAPHLIVIVAHGHQPSASTQTMPSVIETCRAVKQVCHDIPVLIVGGHPAALPERTLKETGADAVCTGEGPTTIYDFIQHQNEGRSGANARGIAWLMNNNLFTKTASFENIWNLTEEMPGGMWEKLPMGRYRAHNWACFGETSRYPYASIYTSLGCPFSCGFCMIQSPFREGDKLTLRGKANSYRMWHPTHVVDEIQELVEKYGVRHLKIADEMFVLNKSHVWNICNQIIERGLGDKLNIWCYARVDTVKDDRMIARMREAGIRWMCLGIESASEFVRDGVDKADYGREDILRACEKLRSHGINLIANFIVGLPDDTTESMRETIRMAHEIMPDFLNLYAAQTYPGSPLWDQAQKEGRELSYDWRTYAHHGYECIPAATRTLTSAEVLRFRDEEFQKFYLSPAYQGYVLTKFGPKAAVEIAEMVRVPLKRKLLGD